MKQICLGLGLLSTTTQLAKSPAEPRSTFACPVLHTTAHRQQKIITMSFLHHQQIVMEVTHTTLACSKQHSKYQIPNIALESTYAKVLEFWPFKMLDSLRIQAAPTNVSYHTDEIGQI